MKVGVSFSQPSTWRGIIGIIGSLAGLFCIVVLRDVVTGAALIASATGLQGVIGAGTLDE